MKRFLFFLCLLLATASPAWAHEDIPITGYLGAAKNIYLAKVTSVQGANISFALNEVLRGRPAHSLSLVAVPGQSYTKESEWLLVSVGPSPYGNNSVGWVLKSDCAWVPSALIHSNGNVYIKTWTFPNSGIILDKLPDGSEGLTLDHLKQLVAQSPQKQ